MVDTRVSAVCSRLVAGIKVSNPAEDMFVRVLCWFCFVSAAALARN